MFIVPGVGLLALASPRTIERASQITVPIRSSGAALPVHREVQAVKRFLTLFVLLSCFTHHSGSLQAQEASGASLTVTPSLGFGVIPENGGLSSEGLTTLLEIDLSRARWRWSVFAAVRGIGVACSDGCESGGQAFGLGLSFLLGGVAVGGGLGGLHRSAKWHVQPHGQLSFAKGVVRLQLRVEVPEGTDGVHVPMLVGLRIPIS